MTTSADDRLARLEHEIRALSDRLGDVERAIGLSPPAAGEPASLRPAAAASVRGDQGAPSRPSEERRPAEEPHPAAAVPARSPSLDLEELLGGRVLAVVGGATVLVGLAFLVALAVERGWIDERARVALAFLTAGGLFAGGVWLSETRVRNQATLAMAGTGVAGLYLALAAATALYDLVPVALALAVAFAVGAAAAVAAIRWDSRTLAGLGILGALVSPVLVDSFPTRGGVLFLAIALAASAAVLLWREWEWLRVAAFPVAMGQVAVWAFEESSPALAVAGVSFFAALNLAAALGYEVRVAAPSLRPSTSLLAAANALVAGGVGSVVLFDAFGVREAGWWMAALALAHVAIGIVVLASRRAARSAALLLFGVGLASADIAFALLVDGPAVAVGWALGAAGLAALARRYSPDEDALVQLTLGGQLSLAIAHTLLFDAPTSALVDGANAGAAYPALVAIAVSAFACARLTRKENETWRRVADGLSVAALAYATALALDGAALVVAWAAEAVTLAQLARRTEDRVATAAAGSFLALAAAHALAFEASPDGLVYGVDSLVAAALALGAVAGVLVRLARLDVARPSVRPALVYLAAAAALVYLASLAIVTAFQPGPEALDTGVGLDVRQQGQALLSAFWSLCGFAALAVGLLRRSRDLRLGGFALLAVAVAKVFLYDMAALEAGWRVLSFVVLGLLLLVAAFAYQHVARAGETGSAGARSS